MTKNHYMPASAFIREIKALDDRHKLNKLHSLSYDWLNENFLDDLFNEVEEAFALASKTDLTEEAIIALLSCSKVAYETHPERLPSRQAFLNRKFTVGITEPG